MNLKQPLQLSQGCGAGRISMNRDREQRPHPRREPHPRNRHRERGVAALGEYRPYAGVPSFGPFSL